MSKVLKTRQALTDLDDIWLHIALDDVSQADKFLHLLLEKCEALGRFPYMGTDQSETALELRSFSIRKYNIYYRAISDGVEIVRVLHGARDIEAVLLECKEDEK